MPLFFETGVMISLSFIAPIFVDGQPHFVLLLLKRQGCGSILKVVGPDIKYLRRRKILQN